ncbi:VOC family protein [Candidatus Mycolicibacterium alkanivorans]|uniref:VOC family protein n=1 Tax=Candidatus Mycolicibacterium alkanivorans TaxID=2954114 RepID=A0ABS9YZW4_9MYCO|nr:VOC family protein [Candidatus Mycolicibacterium alkanivorans]MCI4676806.1 VOC family protein [Candidatus Mycolicibacterium alkanivorans]
MIRQIGYIVSDFEQTIDGRVQLGVGPWCVMRGIAMSCLYRGEPCSVTLTIGFANSGDLQLEVIHQDDDTPSIYPEFTDAGGEGYHQLIAGVATLSRHFCRWCA